MIHAPQLGSQQTLAYRTVLGLCLLLSCKLAFGAPSSADVAPVAGNVKYTSSLSRLMTRDEQIMLRNASSEYVLSVPISGRWQVRRAKLHLEFTNSNALVGGRSQLIVSVNQRRIAQLPLKSTSPDGSADVVLPAELLKEGYNQLKFEVAQHYTEECEDPTAPELWTQIDTLASVLDLEVTPRTDVYRLSQMSRLFDRRVWGEVALNIVTPANTPRESLLRWGGLVAQAAALRLDYVPLHVHAVTAQPRSTGADAQRALPGLQQSALRGRDNVLVGTKESLTPLIGEAHARRITGGFLGVFPLDEDPAHFVMVVSGVTEDDVTRAATALALIDFPYADAATMGIGALNLPALANYSAPHAVREGGRYRFAELDFDGVTLHGFKRSNRNSAALTFWVPPDLYASERDDVVLSLHMVYGAGLREDSVLNILLNDHFESAIALNDKNGAMFRDYQVRIPARSLRPGKNVISFEPHMTSQVSDHCKLGQTENMLITLFDDSTLHIPNAAHYVALPDLTLLSRAGFPYTRAPDGRGVSFQVAGDDAATTAAAWTVAGRLAQALGLPLHQATWSGGESAAGDADLIVIGAQNAIDPALRGAAPLGLSAEAQAPLQTQLAIAEQAKLAWWERLMPGTRDVVLRPAMAEMQQSGGLGRYTAMAQFESPQHAGKTVTLITAADSRTLAAGANALVRPAVWNNMQGASMMWLEDGGDVRTQASVDVYHSGRINVLTRLEYYFSRHPVYGALILVLIIAILALLAWLLLARFRRRHHPTVSNMG